MIAIYHHDKRKVPDVCNFKPLTREELLALKIYDHTLARGVNGKMYRVRVNGKVKTWKTNAAIKIPIKYGLRECAYGGKGLPSLLTLYKEVV
jgi:hypothetical protein